MKNVLSKLILWPALAVFLFSCSVNREAFNPEKKYRAEELQQDYRLFRNILEDSHPGLYWYTSKDSMNAVFDKGFRNIRDSMTEPQFKNILSSVVTAIQCGHTSVRYSKNYSDWQDTAKVKLFPFGLKFWNDTMVVTLNINRKDSVLKRGTILTSINGHTQKEFTDSFFHYLSVDGNSIPGKYQSLSNGFTFGSLYKQLYGLPDSLLVSYLDSNGTERTLITPVYDPATDTAHRGIRFGSGERFTKISKKERKQQFLFATRNLQVDTIGSTAFMTLNTFSHGNRLRSFFRSSFKTLEEKQIKNLVIDVRTNGGGDASNSTLLTKYLADRNFKLADSLYAVRRHTAYGKYIEDDFLYRVLMNFVTKKREDGYYHFGYFERHVYHPKKNHHFNGQVYILTGGNSFSATCLFAGTLKGQKNITLVGEETGGGYYGNNAWMIPQVTLPITKIRFRLPLFRLVVDKTRIKDGRGVLPDVPALPSTISIRNGLDFKAEKARELIRLRQAEKN
jgi:hypothetical protein